MNDDELWERIEAAIQHIVHIVGDTGVVMRNSDIADKVVRNLPPDVSIATDVIERMLENYWAMELDDVEPPEDG